MHRGRARRRRGGVGGGRCVDDPLPLELLSLAQIGFERGRRFPAIKNGGVEIPGTHRDIARVHGKWHGPHDLLKPSARAFIQPNKLHSIAVVGVGMARAESQRHGATGYVQRVEGLFEGIGVSLPDEDRPQGQEAQGILPGVAGLFEAEEVEELTPSHFFQVFRRPLVVGGCRGRPTPAIARLRGVGGFFGRGHGRDPIPPSPTPSTVAFRLRKSIQKRCVFRRLESKKRVAFGTPA